MKITVQVTDLHVGDELIMSDHTVVIGHLEDIGYAIKIKDRHGWTVREPGKAEVVEVVWKES